MKAKPPEEPEYLGLEDLPRIAHFGDTVSGGTMFPFDPPLLLPRTEIRPLPATWTCSYCRCVNPPANVHCAHCGAPHVEKPEQPNVEEAQAQVQGLERTLIRLQSLVHRIGEVKTIVEAPGDSDEFEPDEEGETELTDKRPWKWPWKKRRREI